MRSSAHTEYKESDQKEQHNIVVFLLNRLDGHAVKKQSHEMKILLKVTKAPIS